MNSFVFGHHLPEKSCLYQIDPRLKLLLVFLIIIASFLNHLVLGWLILFSISIAMLKSTKLKLTFFFKETRFFIYIILLTSLIQVCFSNGGKVYAHWGIFTISNLGLQIATMSFLRFLIAITVLTSYLMTTKATTIAQTIQSICYPLKFLGINLDDIGLVTTIALRFVPTLMSEVINLRNAQKSRGLNYQNRSVISRIKGQVSILLPLFVNVFRRAEQLSESMILRGYTDGKQRTHLRELSWKKNDTLSFFVIILIFIGLLLLNIK